MRYLFRLADEVTEKYSWVNERIAVYAAKDPRQFDQRFTATFWYSVVE